MLTGKTVTPEERERRRYEIARDVLAAIANADMMGALDPLKSKAAVYGFVAMARDAVSFADALLDELDR